MSLKAFHVFFITVSSLLCFACGAWELKNAFSPEGARMDFVYGGFAIMAGVGLIAYEYFFLKKTKNVSFL